MSLDGELFSEISKFSNNFSISFHASFISFLFLFLKNYFLDLVFGNSYSFFIGDIFFDPDSNTSYSIS